MIIAGIAGAEAGFWIALGLALVARYLLRQRTLSTVLLWSLPVIDLALLALVVIDLAGGSAPTASHALAASYLGFTIAFGHPLIRWADAAFAHRFAGAARPPKPAKGSAAQVRALWTEWLRVVLAAVIASVILAVLALAVRRDPIPRTLEEAGANPLWAQMITLGVVVVIWFLAGPAFARRTEATPHASS
ncbi:putative Uncharacterized membrane protein YmcC [Microbacterium sp. 8M]|uniref:hypothetical protein n=1 Tax=Microbacterium sp. 8M TaxID=2653153 RepID=UPI0012F12EF2|nr:hypothetical protein [Microbacterium sp. 8M]VXC17858.1 putative Uncharacterized membrane protein YmcC [Microbacterium sp. 8M]